MPRQIALNVTLVALASNISVRIFVEGTLLVGVLKENQRDSYHFGGALRTMSSELRHVPVSLWL